MEVGLVKVGGWVRCLFVVLAQVNDRPRTQEPRRRRRSRSRSRVSGCQGARVSRCHSYRPLACFPTPPARCPHRVLSLTKTSIMKRSAPLSPRLALTVSVL
ncbi:hypothetical protein E2C01_092268 [Portunus trituberculatus]|uniref:Secreted protein n=1 Tax=Portunus trituberculatus TaxID=210409 RepID=A0A5B7JRA6_PORTR|nr:hypothetical protein [Portunus trituberculatus]